MEGIFFFGSKRNKLYFFLFLADKKASPLNQFNRVIISLVLRGEKRLNGSFFVLSVNVHILHKFAFILCFKFGCRSRMGERLLPRGALMADMYKNCHTQKR